MVDGGAFAPEDGLGLAGWVVVGAGAGAEVGLEAPGGLLGTAEKVICCVTHCLSVYNIAFPTVLRKNQLVRCDQQYQHTGTGECIYSAAVMAKLRVVEFHKKMLAYAKKGQVLRKHVHHLQLDYLHI